MLRWVTLFAVLLGTSLAAHSPLQSSVPANDAVVAAAPEALDLMFQNPIRLTKVTLAVDGGAPTNLVLESVEGFVLQYSVLLGDQGSGDYAIEWRGLGDDGHPMQGTIRFMVE